MTDLLDTEPLTSLIEWSARSAADLLDEGTYDGKPITRRLVLQAIEDLSRYAAIENADEVLSIWQPPKDTSCPGPVRGIEGTLAVLVEMLGLLIVEEAEDARRVEVPMTAGQARSLWNLVMGEDKPEDLHRVKEINRFNIEGALG